MLDRITNGQSAHASDSGGVPLIRWCAYYGDVSAVRMLLAHGEALTSLGLNGAAFHGHWRLCEFLVEQGADVNAADPESGETPLHSALCTTNRAAHDLVVRVLLTNGAGAKVDARDMHGDTPLSWASWYTRPDAILRLLLYDGHAIRSDRQP